MPAARASSRSRPSVGLTNIVIAFVCFWVVVYGVVTWYFMTVANEELPGGSGVLTNNIVGAGGAGAAGPLNTGDSAATLPDLQTDPFLSSSCRLTIGTLTAPPPKSVSVIIPVRNERKAVLARTIDSILKNSDISSGAADGVLHKIVLVDVASAVPVSEWSDITGRCKSITVIRLEKPVGLAVARNRGAEEVFQRQQEAKTGGWLGGGGGGGSGISVSPSHMLVFLTSHSVVSQHWLTPLYNTLLPSTDSDFVSSGGGGGGGRAAGGNSIGENVVVFPTVDVWDGDSEDLIAADDNLVGGFTWGLGFRWEEVYQGGQVGARKVRSKRIVPSSSTSDAGGDDAHAKDRANFSPSTPGIMAITAKFFNALGGFDGSLDTAGDVPTVATASEINAMKLLQRDTERSGPPMGGGKHTFYWAHEDIADPTMTEFSLRVWLCGGRNAAIVHQPCSRVANRYSSGVTAEVAAGTLVGGGGTDAGGSDGNQQQRRMGDGVTQRAVDHTIMRIAEYWFYPVAYRDVIYQARFLNRMPYTVTDINAQLRSPAHKFSLPTLAAEQCMTMDWYLNEVYPGLLQEMDVVRYQFQKYVDRSGFVEGTLAPLVAQYHKESLLTNINSAEVEKMRQYAATDRKLGRKGIVIGRDGVEQDTALEGSAANNALTEEEQRKIAEDSHENHVVMVREMMVCEDQPRTWEWDDCASKVAAGFCSGGGIGYMMFGCPKSCGFCDANKPTELCTDFFLMKCPAWAKEGQCVENKAEMEVSCRVSCGLCQQIAGAKPNLPELPAQQRQEAPKAVALEVHNNIINSNSNSNKNSNDAKAGNDAAMKHVELVNKMAAPGGGGTVRMDPYVAQRQYHDGLLPDPLVDANQGTRCEMRGRPNGELLDHVHIAPHDPSGPRNPKIFCGIYTMQSKHKDNVQATKETWAKKCTGFVAFSTATDPTIPALAIQHEGEESYNNMWQKSKSIWMYIAAHYLDDFDFFVMGGDDMFYLMENLYAYLGSDTIQDLVAQSEYGVYLGRRFTPPKQKTFNSGGAGYVLDKKALRLLRDNIDTQRCYNHQVGFWEDVNIAHCLLVASDEKLSPFDTRDEMGRERFHPFSPGQHLTFGVPTLPKDDWYVKYNPQGLLTGPDCCSSGSVSFHYIGAELMRKLHAYVYNCPLKKNL